MELLRQVWKRRLLVIAVACATTGLVALWTLRQPKIYQASVSLEFDPNPARPLGEHVDDLANESDSYWTNQEFYTTQYQIIQSQRVAEGVVRQLGLQHDPDFFGVPADQRRTFHSLDVSSAAQVLRGRLRVDPVRDSRLVNIRVEDTSPRRAQLLANTVADVFIRQNLENKLSTTVSALEWLGQQLESLRGQLESSEMALHEYRIRNNLLSVSFEDRRNTLGNRIEQLSSALTQAQQRRMAAASKVVEIRRAVQADDPMAMNAPELLQSSVLEGFRRAFEEARRNRDILSTRYGEGSMQFRAADAAVNDLRDAVRREGRNILEAAESDLRSSRRMESDLHASLTDAQREGLELNLREIEYGRLQRQRENNSKLYGLVLDRTKETDLTRLQRVNNMRIVDPALLPGGPIKPRVGSSIIMGLFVGIFFGVLAAAAVIQADRTVRSQEDIEGEIGATFLGVLPRIETRTGRLGYRYRYRYGGSSDEDEKPVENPDLIVHSHPNSSVAEACRVIRTNLLFMSPDHPFQTLMVSSAAPRDGKTTVAVSLALTLAQSAKRVLLIDTDLRRPRVHKAFGLRPPVGITSVLVGECSLDEAILETEVPNLFLLPCGPIPPNPAELLHSQKFNELLERVRGQFERVILDTPPVGVVSDALVVSSQVDGTVLVARARKTLRARAAAIVAQIRLLGGRMAGLVLNDVDLSREGGTTYYYEGAYNYRPRRDAA